MSDWNRLLWVSLAGPNATGLDEAVVRACREVVERFSLAVRASDGVRLVLLCGPLAEDVAGAAVMRTLAGLDQQLASTGDITLHEGYVPADVPRVDVLLDAASDIPLDAQVAAAQDRLHWVRSELAPFVAVTPVKDRADWAASFWPTRGFHHLVVDNASSDGTPDLVEARGGQVVRHEKPVGRLASWQRAVDTFRAQPRGQWMKWQFAGDLLLPGAADLLQEAVNAAPEVGLVVCEYLIDSGDGRAERWRTLPRTMLVEPELALRLSAEGGNWFGSPIGHLFSRAALDLLEIGTQPWVGDWEACLSVAQHLPVLYVAEPVGVFDMASRRHYASQHASLHARVQESEVRLRSCALLAERAAPDSALQQHVEQWVRGAVSSAVGSPASAFAPPPFPPSPAATAPARTAPRSADGPADPRPGVGPVIALHHPRVQPGARDFHGYAPLFAQRYASIAYLPLLATHPESAPELGVMDGVMPHPAGALEVVTSARELQQRADVLVGLEGRPYLDAMRPPPEFTGLKAYHVMDFVFHASAAAAALERGGVDVVLGYARHDRHSDFFRSIYASFAGRVLPVPFGFADRFAAVTPFTARLPKAIGLGAVNPVDDPLCPPGELDDYTSFYAGVQWTHVWRRRLIETRGRLADILDSRWPRWPETKDSTPDPAAVLNAYQLFVNDDGLLAFPPARTYEGIAAGAVLVGNDFPGYAEIGLEHGKTALLHRPHDVEDFARVVREALAEPERLREIADAGRLLVTERYDHDTIAETLYQELVDLARNADMSERRRDQHPAGTGGG